MNAVESTSNATNTFGSIMVGRRLAMHDRAANRPAGQLDSAGVDLRGKDSFGRQTCLLGEVRKLALHAPCPRTSNQSATTLNSSPRSGGTLRKAHMAPRWRRARWQQTGRSVPGASVDGVGGRGGALQLPIDAAVLVGRWSSSSSALRPPGLLPITRLRRAEASSARTSIESETGETIETLSLGTRVKFFTAALPEARTVQMLLQQQRVS